MTATLDKEVALLGAKVENQRERVGELKRAVDAHTHTIAQIPRLQDDAAAAVAKAGRIDAIEATIDSMGKDIAGIKATLTVIGAALDKAKAAGSERELRWVKWLAGVAIVGSGSDVVRAIVGTVGG